MIMERSVTHIWCLRWGLKRNQVRQAAEVEVDEGPKLQRGGYRGIVEKPSGGAEVKSHASGP